MLIADMSQLSDLKPRSKQLMFDLAEEAGFDMTDWRDSSNDPRGPKANPKYCYEWAYVQPGKLIILNLWHPSMVEEDGRIIQRANFRSDAEFHRTVSGKAEWARRAQRLDDAIQTALRDNLPVRVVLLDGLMRNKEEVDSKPSSVKKRELDPEPWTITKYSWDTGAFELTRGILAARYVDQFDLDQADKSEPERKDVSGSVFVRDPAVRKRVLNRASGYCELCGEAGFRMESGALYLETHHVIPLSEGGPDDDRNVVALCANDHRRAHFSEERAAIRTKLLAGIPPTI
jgi:Predicted restriction endonuclease